MEDRLVAALEATAAGRGPGLFALVADAGEVVFSGSVGTADVRARRPIARADRFRIASLTKIMLAAVTLQLVAEGRLLLADLVQRWLPDLGAGALPAGWPVTVGHLLAMRSGLPD